MDLPASVPARRGPGPRAAALTALAFAGVIALWLAIEAGVAGPAAVPRLALTSAVAMAFFALCGYGPARLLLPADLRPRLWLYAFPVGAACGTLAMTLLGLLHVPFDAALAATLAAGAAIAVLAVRRAAPPVPPAPEQGGLTAHVAVPLALAVLIGAVACLPAFRAGYPAVQGQNGDAIMAVGFAEFLQHQPPSGRDPALGLDRAPVLWRSKLPIYYGLAAVARLSGQETLEAFTPLAGVVMALAALGFFLFVRDGFGAPVLVALAAMAVAGLDRMVLNVAYGPFFNQLWALFALPFALLFGWCFLRDPGRRSAALAGLFLALALFTYPLLLPFPAVFFAVLMWQRRRQRGWWRALRLPAPRRAGVRYVLLGLLAIPVTAVLVRGVVEKAIPGMLAIAPGGDLSAWSGNDVLPFLPFTWFFGVSLPSPWAAIVTAGVFAAAAYGLRRVPRDGAVAIAVLIAGGVLGAVWLLIRGAGELFHFKDLSFTGPLLILVAVVGLGALRPRRLAAAAVVAYVVIAAFGARDAAVGTFVQTPGYVLELREWDREVPVDQSIRIDVPQSGWQLWSWYLMPRHAVSASEPLGGFFPHPPLGRKADLALVLKPDPRPRDAVGPPVRENDGFVLYRLSEDIPGPDVSSQGLVYE